MTGTSQFLAYAFFIIFACQTSFSMEPDHSKPPSLIPSSRGTTHELKPKDRQQSDNLLPTFPFDIPESVRELTEEEARDKAQREFCLCGDDKIGNWKTTFIMHSLFWQYYRHEKALKVLAHLGCALAQIYITYPDDEFYFNSFDDLVRLMTSNPESSDVSFLQALSNQDLLKLCRDSYLFNVVGYMKLATLPIKMRVQQHNLRSNSAMEGGGRMLRLDDIPVSPQFTEMTTALTDTIRIAGQVLRKKCHQELLRRGNSSYLLFSIHNTTFSAVFFGLDDLLLYKQAQAIYQKKYGKIHTGVFNPLFSIPLLEALKAPQLLHNTFEGRDLDLYKMDADQTRRIEEVGQELIAMGDTLWAFNLGVSWYHKIEYVDEVDTPEYNECLTKAHCWLTLSLQYEQSQQAAQKYLALLERERHRRN